MTHHLPVDDMVGYPRLVRTNDRVVRTAERDIPVSRVRLTFGDLGDVMSTAISLGISPESVAEAILYANSHFIESY